MSIVSELPVKDVGTKLPPNFLCVIRIYNSDKVMNSQSQATEGRKDDEQALDKAQADRVV